MMPVLPRYYFFFTGLLIVILIFYLQAISQTEAATISGTITDQTGAIITGANIVLTNVLTGDKATTKSNNSGFYVFPAVHPSQYRMTVEKSGFRQVVLTGLRVNVQDALSRNFSLQPGVVGESVTVRGDAMTVNTESAAVSTLVDQQFVDNIPMNGRSFQSLIELTPGITAVPGAGNGSQGEFSINGQRTEANYYTVDGVSANTGQFNIWQGGSTPQETLLGTTQGMVSLDALQEFRINTSSYSAEYGRMPGGQISFTTRSGTNAWHGSLFDYFRNDVLDANNWFNGFWNNPPLPKTHERQNDFGGTIGGPVRIPGLYNGTDKTFFFFSYEGMRLIIPTAVTPSHVPDMYLRQNAPAALQPFVNAFPLPNGPDLGPSLGVAVYSAAFSSPSNMNAYSVRVDHSFGEKIKLFGRYADTPSSSQGPSAPGNFAEWADSSSDIKVITLGATGVFSPNLVNDLRFNYTRNTTDSRYTQDNYGGAKSVTAAQCLPGATLPKYFSCSWSFGYDWYEGVFIGNTSIPSHQWNINDTLTSVFGSHTLKYGVDYRQQYGIEGANQLTTNFTFNTIDQILTNSGTAGVSEGPLLGGLYKNFSAFAEDEWKATQRVHLSLGLRWDLNPPPTGTPNTPYTLNEITNLATSTLAPKGTALYHTDYRGFAPRIGVVYQLRQNPGHETVVRGGFGVFYDIGNANALLGSQLGVGLSSSAQYANNPFPLTLQQLNLPPPSINTAWTNVSADDPYLRLPYTLEWNAAIEHGLGTDQTLTLSYIGAGGRKLLHTRYFAVNQPGGVVNPNFTNNGSADIFLTTNGATSGYNAFQAQLKRRLSHGFQALVSYTWAHSIDDESYNGNWNNGAGTTDVLLRGNSVFDVRQNFSAALSYSVQGNYENPFLGALLKHWGIDLRQANRTALPVDITDGYTTLPISHQNIQVRPDLVPNTPIYIHDSSAPGGREINFYAFSAPAGLIGNEPRNFVRGFGAWQTDLTLRREFPLFRDFKLQFRAEAYNVFNHPNYGSINSDISWYNPTSYPTIFGQANSTLNNSLGGANSLYQMGGPRSLQLALKLIF